MKKILATLAFCTAFATQAWAAGLIVVEDLGGASALPYYQGLIRSHPLPHQDLATWVSVAQVRFQFARHAFRQARFRGAPSTPQACNLCSSSATTRCLESG